MKSVLITGAGSGIGKAASKEFLKEEWHVIMADINEAALKEISNQFVNEGFENVYYKQVDLTKKEEMKTLYEYAVNTVGQIDSLINNAGITHMAELHETTEEEWDSQFNLIVKAIYYSSIYFVPHMIENKGGTIVNTASISGLQADYNMAAYNAAKGAVVNLTRAMALDYGKYNIRVNSVAPYATNTPLFGKNPPEVVEAFKQANPMGRIAEPEDIARTMQFLASDESEFINGATIPVSGGVENYSGQPVQ